MNKQVVIAGLLGAASAVTACDGPFVAAATLAKADLVAKKAAEEAKTAAIDLLVTSAGTAFDTAQGRVTAQNLVIAPFNTAKASASTAVTTKTTAQTAATALETSITALQTTAEATRALAATAVTNQDNLISAQTAIVVKLTAAKTQHEEEKVTLLAVQAAKTTAATTAATTLTDAGTAKTTLETERAVATTGQAALKVAADSAENLATTNNTTEVGLEAALWVTYKASKLAFDTITYDLAQVTAACVFVSHTCNTYASDQTRVLFDAATSTQSSANTTNNTAKAAWDTGVLALATTMDILANKKILAEIALANDTTIATAITTAGTAVTTATAANGTAETEKTTATTNVTTVTGQITQAVADLARGVLLETALKNAKTPLSDALTIAIYLKKIETDKLAIQVAAKAAAALGLVDLGTLETMAQESVTRAQGQLDFFTGLLTTATTTKNAADGMKNANTALIGSLDSQITMGDSKLAGFVQQCKEAGYALAQSRMAAKISKQTAETAAAVTVATDYGAKAAFSTSGETNTLCAYPAKAKDAAQDPRPVCKDGFCCGAAQKFLKDGTKLAIETCQKNIGVHTYAYYPPLPAGAAVEPAPETWRFQCISGAQKLVATATAALAASYLMA